MASLKRKANRRKKIVKRIMDNMEPCTRGIGDFRKDIDVQAIYRTMEKMSEAAAEFEDMFWWTEHPLKRMMRQPMKIVDPNSTSTMKGKGYDCY